MLLIIVFVRNIGFDCNMCCWVIMQAMIAKKQHFAYSTPTKVPAFRCSIDQSVHDDVGEIEAPNAPKQSRVARSRLDKKKLAGLAVALFASDE